MRRLIPASAAMALAALIPGAGAQAEMLHTMPHGTYECAYPGDAAGAAWEPVKEASFRIGRASSYRSIQGRGVYLLKGKILTFTRGPMKGRQLQRTGHQALRQIEADGSLGRMSCVRVLSKS